MRCKLLSGGKTNIVLIGMPGSGKTTIGKRLAKKYDLPFVDSDHLLEQYCNMPIQQVVNRMGLKRFCQLEQAVLCDSQFDNSIVSTGGSAIYSEHAMRKLGENGARLYLQISPQTLIRRVSNQSQRGLVKYPSHHMLRLYADRKHLYPQYADVTFKNDAPLTAANAAELYRILES